MRLDAFKCVGSDDPAKIDLELKCDECGEHLCDIEAGDDLDILLDVATDHTCRKDTK